MRLPAELNVDDMFSEPWRSFEEDITFDESDEDHQSVVEEEEEKEGI